MKKSTTNAAVQTEAVESQSNLMFKTLIHHIDDARYDIELEFEFVGGTRQRLVVSRSSAATPSLVHTKLLDAGAKLPDRKEALALIATVLSHEPSKAIQHTKRGG